MHGRMHVQITRQMSLLRECGDEFFVPPPLRSTARITCKTSEDATMLCNALDVDPEVRTELRK